MENSFNLSLSGIHTLMTVMLEAHRNAGLAGDEATIKLFREKLKPEIIAFKNAAIELELKKPDNTSYETLVMPHLADLVRLMKSPHPEWSILGWYVSPDEREPLYFWAYQDLYELVIWIVASTRRQDLPLQVQSLVREQYKALSSLEQSLHEKGVDKLLVKALMSAFDKVRGQDPVDLTYAELITLGKVREAIVDCCNTAQEHLADGLIQLLYVLNINTWDAINFCQRHMDNLVDAASSPTAVLKLLAYHEKLLLQTTIASKTVFDNFYKPLKDEILHYIKFERKFYNDETAAPKNGSTAVVPDSTGLIAINMPNQHYAARLHVKHACGRYKNSKNALIRATCKQTLSNKDTALSETAFFGYFDKLTEPAVKGAFDMNLEELGWMCKHWSAEYGVPNLFKLNERDLKNFFLALEASIPS
jgi:hypothetical protein